MGRFYTVLENALRNNTQLRRIKLRVDPAYCENGKILKYDGYEGFILAESRTKYRVLIEDTQGTIVVVPRNMVEINYQASPLDKLKLIALNQLNLVPEDVTLIKLTAANTPEAFEALLKEHGCKDCDIIKLYKIAYFGNTSI